MRSPGKTPAKTSAKTKIAINALGVGIVALGSLIYGYLVNGKPIDPSRLWLVLVLPPLFGFFIWLRWDWAPEQRRKWKTPESEVPEHLRREIEAQKDAPRSKDET